MSEKKSAIDIDNVVYELQNDSTSTNLETFSTKVQNHLALWNEDDDKDKRKKKTKKIVSIIIDTVLVILLIVFGGSAAFNFMFEQRIVSGSSMKPTFNAFVTTEKSSDEFCDVIFYREAEVSRGDVIIATHEETLVIKRLIALENDRIKFDLNPTTGRTTIFLNGQPLEENYLGPEFNDMVFKANTFNELKNGIFKDNFDNEGYLKIPKGYVFYVGDNRINSRDCVNYGPVKQESVLGKVYYKVLNKERNSIPTFLQKSLNFYKYVFGILNPNF